MADEKQNVSWFQSAKEGLEFGRAEDGSVLIKKGEEVIRLSSDAWCSVMAAVSARGDIKEVWEEARFLHMVG